MKAQPLLSAVTVPATAPRSRVGSSSPKSTHGMGPMPVG